MQTHWLFLSGFTPIRLISSSIKHIHNHLIVSEAGASLVNSVLHQLHESFSNANYLGNTTQLNGSLLTFIASLR
jgi:hypothetical protein